MGLDFVKNYGGQRMRSTKRKSVFAEMNTEQLNNFIPVYEEMRNSESMPDGEALTKKQVEDVSRQILLMKNELACRKGRGCY